MKYSLIFSLLIFYPHLGKAEDLSGFFISVRGIVENGTTTYQNGSDSLTGWAGEGAIGWRFPSVLKCGILGIYENLSLQTANSTIGPMNFAGYGAMARVFFISSIFLEGSGGLTQSRMTTSSTGADLVANGSFYTIGPGAEIKLNDNISIEFSIRVRNVLYSQNEYQATRSIFYSGGLSVYFR